MANRRSRRASCTGLIHLLRNMDCGLFLLICLIAFLSSLQSCEGQGIGADDTDGLLAFKTAADGNGVLNRSWVRSTPPCGGASRIFWLGIQCNDRGRVSSVLLSSFQLNGTFPENSLSKLSELRLLVLGNNSLTGPLPRDLSNLTGLLQFWAQNAEFSGPFPNISEKIGMLDLSGNNLSGPIPDLSDRTNLTVLDLSANHFEGNISNLPASMQSLNLSDNALTGIIPPDLSGLTNLSRLDLSVNQLQGQIPPLSSDLQTLDLSGNSLTGSVPTDLQRFSNASFEGNPGLCGLPTTTACASAPAPANSSDTVAATRKKKSKKLNSVIVAFLAVAGLAVILFMLAFLRYYHSRRGKNHSGKKNHDSSGMSSLAETDKLKLTFFDEGQHNYDLEDLLRASAEMLGKGSLGTAYKAVMETGMVVAVKRVRDVKDMRRKDFDQHMEMLGALRHPNLVPLRAYYFAKDERLLIYDFMPNGSLFSLLHG